MPRVADDEPDIMFLREGYHSSIVRRTRRVDRIGYVSADNAWGITGRKWIAAHIGEERGHGRVCGLVVKRWPCPVLLNPSAFLSVVRHAREGIVTGAGDRHRSYQFATQGLVQMAPLGQGGPTFVARKATAMWLCGGMRSREPEGP